MTVVADLLMILGAFVAVLAGIGILKFQTPYSRFHAAGKASPVAAMALAAGAAIHLGWSAAGILLLAVVAMAVTLPFGMHLLIRAIHRSGTPD